MTRLRLITGFIVTLSIIATMAAMHLPVPAHNVNAQVSIQRITQGLGITVGVMSLTIGAALLFLLNLSGFKTSFRKAYYLISAGIVAQALSSLGYAILQYVTFWTTDLTIYSRDLPLAAIAAVLLYLGVRRFAQILDVPSWKINARMLLGVTVLGLPAIWLLPLHASFYGSLFSSQSAWLLRLADTWGLLEILFLVFGAVLLSRIRAAAGSHYKRPLLWFWWALIGAALGAAIYLLTDYIVWPSWFRLEYVAIPYFASYLFLLIAAYSFAAITLQPEKQQKASVIDVIVYVASLASKPTEIDPILDDLRAITAQGRPNEATPAYTARLLEVYSRLEDYLVTREPLRTYDRRALREQLQERFSLPPDLSFIGSNPPSGVKG